jgi:hypothetical protein
VYNLMVQHGHEFKERVQRGDLGIRRLGGWMWFEIARL